MQKTKTAAAETHWAVTLRDGTVSHPLDVSPTTTQVDKTAFPTQEQAVEQAARQLGVLGIGPGCWWEVHG
jgi:hypothetical protein